MMEEAEAADDRLESPRESFDALTDNIYTKT